MKQASPVSVEVQNGLPYRVNGVTCSSLVDAYRLWPNWWEGYAPRDYYLLTLETRTLLIYRSKESWFHASTLD